MTKGMGKVLLEMKKAGKVISETAGEVGTAIGVASIDIADKTKKSVGELSDRAKKSAKIAMLKAEIDDMYKDLGKSIFEDGMLLTNDRALAIMDVLFVKHDELEALELEVLAEKLAKMEAKEVKNEVVDFSEEETEVPDSVETEEEEVSEAPSEAPSETEEVDIEKE